jgi:nitroimidazol reductase NimA-like FMN-containing flavoprotein (pyridoxamine 5'-phosphate oxidase superfamily)
MGKMIRRIDRAIPEGKAKELLKRGEYGILSTVSKEGQPYGVPLSYSYAEDSIYFHCALEGHVVNNIRESDRVSFCIVGKTEVLPDKFGTKYESVIVFGKVSELTGDEKQKGLLELLKKYSAGFIKEGLQYIENAGNKTRVYKIVIESITGKSKS